MRKRDRWPEWLRKLPSEWDAPYLKLVARVESGHTPSRSVDEYWRPEECTIPWFSLADIWQLREGRQKYLGETAEKASPAGLANSSARLLPRGTVVLSRTASVGFSGIMPRPMATTQDFVNFVPGPKLASDYLLWVLRGMAPEFERLRMGSTHKTIYMPDVLEFRSPTPPLNTQQAIADFLDRKTAAIDDLIEKKERLIELLQEKRQALITQAVTKGLDPSVPMRESGVEWIGEVPAHWDVLALGMRYSVQLGKMLNPDASAGAHQAPYLRNTDVQWGRINTVDLPTMSFDAEDRRKFSLEANDLLVCEGGDVGRCAIWREESAEVYYQKALHRLRPLAPDEDPSYMEYMLRAAHGCGEFQSRGNRATIAHLTAESFRRYRFCRPPLEEQRDVVSYLNEATSSLSALLNAVSRSIELLREYRQALITNAVTGQLDIPGAA